MGLLSFQGRYRILHLTWFAFFLTFVIWFNFAPLATTIKEQMGLSEDQIRTIGICNVALTVPARVILGMLLDRYGPRLTFSWLLIFSTIPCIMFAFADSFNTLIISRLLLGIIGGGFVIGIRMVSEWFPPREVGLAEGIYGGWGNFGSAFSALTLASVAAWLSFGGSDLNWRLAIAITGIIGGIYGVIYLFSVEDTPPGRTYQRPERHGALEITSKRDFWLLLIMSIPTVAVLAVLTFKLQNVGFFSVAQRNIVWGILLAIYVIQAFRIWQVNKEVVSGKRRYPDQDRYPFRQVAMLELTYVTNFGSELAVVSMLPAFFERTFNLSPQLAGAVGSSYAVMNLFSRASGGAMSDRLGSRKWTMAILLIVMGLCYLMMSTIGGNWWLPAAMALTMLSSFFVQAAEGSTYSIVPLVKKRLTGQISGLVGAYGTVGAVAYTTTYSYLPGGTTGDAIFFQVLGISGLIVGFLCVFFLKEPANSFAADYEGFESETGLEEATEATTVGTKTK
ncbi:MAG: MFS transporter [Cyanobacteria bacterium SW_9_44_58]|nr:MAG: MFS transporter [Cyanobacteria bacterium SW_9_44_58]